ncbi:MAG: hypothetical protein JO124_17240 [Hyphomicrobiales bacterium]|nr:hypothetical protein [Hyphomicrobiales bacterium]MBV9751024.1 hypothetical protein [Hyphomicrobiales bacterium]MBV9977433.1 hypothetical protein [Hyphomicrobiales bacterium]
MDETRLTFESFASLAERLGYSLSTSQLRELHEAYGHVAKMAERVRGTASLTAESAMVFAPNAKARRS